MLYLNLLIISFCVVYVIDISGFYDEMSAIISGWLTHGKRKEPFYIKPFCCSLCMTLWTTLLYILIVGSVTIPTIGYCFLLSFLAPTFKDILQNVNDCLAFINAIINDIFQRKGLK